MTSKRSFSFGQNCFKWLTFTAKLILSVLRQLKAELAINFNHWASFKWTRQDHFFFSKQNPLSSSLFSLFPRSFSSPLLSSPINSCVCSSYTSQCFHLSPSAWCELDVLSCAAVMLWIRKAKLNCLIGFLGKGKTDLNWLPVMAFCGTTLASAVWGGFSKTN